MKKKRWTFKNSANEDDVLALADSLNIPNILADLLIQRGVTNFFEAKTYFRPSLDDLLDPFEMDGMEKASIRVIEAITSNEKIFVYGDYDVDGTCSAALMYLFLKELGADAEVYIPNRLNDGYGLSKLGIDEIHSKEATLIITVDCGITAVEEIDYANSLGIDSIICDHHQPKEKIPNAYSVLDPIKPNDDYSFKYLSGAGVAFKLARAVGDRVGKKDLALQYLDLVALAGAADIVPLTFENRILVRKGLECINKNPRPGIRALISKARMTPGNLSAGQIVFTIAPRINAVGRLGDAKRAVDLFVTKDDTEAEQLANILEHENRERRKIDEMTFTHALQTVEQTINLNEEKGIVLHDNNWHPGVIGIVASRLVEKYYRPSIMLTTIDGLAKGSARSVTGFNIYDALIECEDILVQYGGHEAAAGLAIEVENVPEFRRRFNKVLQEKLKDDDILPEIKIDTKLSFSEITPKFLRILEQFAPFGPGNMKPIFMSENVSVKYPPRIVGKNHIILYLEQENCDKVFDSIGFNLGGFANLINRSEDKLDIVYTIERVDRNGCSYPQLRLKDIRIKEK